MARYQYLVLTTADPDRVDEFHHWYDTEHLRDVVAVPGVASARRYKVMQRSPAGLPEVPWDSFAIYEIDSDEPNEVLSRITETWYAGGMVTTETLRMEPLLTMLAEPAGEYPPAQR